MPDSGEKFSPSSARRAEARYLRARHVWEKNFTGTTATHFGYKHVSEAEREANTSRRAKASIAMNIMQRARQGF
jgi:hypothetical protein